MILAALSSLLRQFLEWFASLLPAWHISSIQGFSDTMQEVWQQAYTWSGVFPIGTVLIVMQIGLTFGTVIAAFNVFMLVLNLVRGSGA